MRADGIRAMLHLGPGDPGCQQLNTTDPVNGICELAIFLDSLVALPVSLTRKASLLTAVCPNYKRLCPNYVANARELVRQLRPYLLNDTIVGIFLGVIIQRPRHAACAAWALRARRAG